MLLLVWDVNGVILSALYDIYGWQVVTPQRLEILKQQLTDEIERAYKERFHKQEQESDEYKMLCNKLKYEVSFVRSEFEHETLEYKRILEEIKLQHEAEV